MDCSLFWNNISLCGLHRNGKFVPYTVIETPTSILPISQLISANYPMGNALNPNGLPDLLDSPQDCLNSVSAYSQNYSILDYYDADLYDVIRDVADGSEKSLSPFAEALNHMEADSHDLSHLNLANVSLNDTLNDDTISSLHNDRYNTASANGTLNKLPHISIESLGVTAAGGGASDGEFCGSWSAPEIPPVTEFSITKILKSKTDMYGFRKQSLLFDSTDASFNEWFSEYLGHFLTQKKKWNLLMKSNGLAVTNTNVPPQRFPPKSHKVKKLIRKGIPPEWRGNAWFFYAGGHEKLNQNVGLYSDIVEATKDVHNKDTEVIERDLHRTFPDNIHFNLSVMETNNDTPNNDELPAIRALRRVLVAIAHYLPHVGYCQSLNFLAGLLLLFMSEERAFWMLVIMMERIIPKVHAANLEGVHTDQGVLMMCIREYIPKLWAIIGKSYDGKVLPDDKILTRLPLVSLVTSSWFMSVFVGVLPMESVLRIWDIIWYEGSKTIFRVSLTICRLCMDHPKFLAKRDSRDTTESDQIELFQFMQSFPKSLTDPNLIIDCCFKKIGGYGYGFVSQAEINNCREFVSHQQDKLKARQQSMVGPQMTEAEREALKYHSPDMDDNHDIYGFNKSIMSGVTWNKHISNRMKKKFPKQLK